MFFNCFKRSNSHDTKKKLPPQPWKLPIVGHLHHLFGALPHHALGNLTERLGPVIRLQLGEVSAVVISSPSFAKEVMKTHDLSFANRPKSLNAEIVGYNYPDIVFSPYGGYRRQMRKICIMELLSAKNVLSFQSIREEESWSLIESMAMHEGSKRINLTEKIFMMMNVIISRVAVGSKCKDQAMLVPLIHELISLGGGFNVAELFPSVKVLKFLTGRRKKLVRIHKKIDQILDNIISDHEEQRCVGGEKNQNEDLVDVLLRLKVDGGIHFPLTSVNVKAVILVSIH